MSDAVAESEAPTLGELMVMAREAKEFAATCKRQSTDADEAFNAIKLQILFAMRDADQDSTSVNGVARARISSKVVPNVVDWDQFYKYILTNQLPELLQKRVLLSGYQELRTSGEEIPGVEDFLKEDVTFTLIND